MRSHQHVHVQSHVTAHRTRTRNVDKRQKDTALMDYRDEVGRDFKLLELLHKCDMLSPSA